MVGFLSEPSIDDPEQAPKLKDSNNSIDPFDPTSSEFSFSDSFPDFDSIKDWFEDTTILDMDDIGMLKLGTPDKPIEFFQIQTPRGLEPVGSVSESIVHGCEASVAGSGCGVKVEEGECEKLGNSSYCVEEEMRKKVILGSDPGNSDLGGGNDVKSEIESDGDERRSTESESESSESESESSFSSVAASSTDSSDDDEEVKEKRESKVEVTTGADEAAEVEEGEIRDGDDEQEMKRGTDDDEDIENNEDYGEGMVDWSDVEEGDGDDDDEGGATRGPIRSTHELEVLPPVPPVDVTLLPHHQMLPVGVVLSIIGAQVIVEGVEKHNPLSEGSILWITESRTPLGQVDEIFGPVKNPYYKVRYNSDNEVPSGIHAGSSISFVPDFAHHVLNDKDLYKKGYDASGANDEEMLDEAEFSDDEKEAEYRRLQKMTKRGNGNKSINEQNVRNKKNNVKAKNKDGQWKNAQPSSSRQPQMCANQLASNQNQHNFSPAVAFSVGQGYVRPGLVPPFPPTAQTVGFNTPSNGVWTNGNYGMPLQPPQGAVFPNGFPANGITWLSQNPQQHLMPMPNSMLFQQQFDPSQRSFPTAMLPAEQSNIFLGPTFAPGLADQNVLNQVSFGMGLQGCHTHPSMNSREQGVVSNGLRVEQSGAMQQSLFTPGSAENPWQRQLNLGASSSRGRKPYHRGGGRFAGGRAGGQSK